MSINMEPSEGRIVLGRARSTEVFPWYEKAGVITRVSGKRIYYKDAEGAEKFLHDFSCIVDTEEEADVLLDFTIRGKAKVQKLLDELAAESEAIHTANVKPVEVRRTRTRAR